MKKGVIPVISLILACLSFGLAYLCVIYHVSPLSITLLIISGILLVSTALFYIGFLIGLAYLTHPENTQDFSAEVYKRKKLAYITLGLSLGLLAVAFATNWTTLTLLTQSLLSI